MPSCRLFLLSLFCALFFLTGCSAIHKQSNSYVNISEGKSVYIIKNPHQRTEIDKMIQDEVQKLGITASIGPSSVEQQNHDYIINYFDAWSWDLVPYLRSLEIQLFDARNNLMIERVRFENEIYFHTFPSDKKITAELIQRIFKKKVP